MVIISGVPIFSIITVEYESFLFISSTVQSTGTYCCHSDIGVSRSMGISITVESVSSKFLCDGQGVVVSCPVQG